MSGATCRVYLPRAHRHGYVFVLPILHARARYTGILIRIILFSENMGRRTLHALPAAASYACLLFLFLSSLSPLPSPSGTGISSLVGSFSPVYVCLAATATILPGGTHYLYKKALCVLLSPINLLFVPISFYLFFPCHLNMLCMCVCIV